MGAHFKGEATADRGARPGPATPSWSAARPRPLPEVVKLLEQLDRKPRTVEVEITIVEVPAAKDGKELTPADLATAECCEGRQGSADQAHVGRGPAGHHADRREQALRQRPAVRRAAAGFGARAAVHRRAKSINYQAVGTTVKMTPRIGADNAVSLE